MYPLDFLAERVVYSRPLDLIVSTEYRSNTLRFIDPNTGFIDSIELAYRSDALVLAPDELSVVADHARSVSVVSLQAKALTKLVKVGVYGSLAVSGDWIYVLPRGDKYRSPHSLIRSINYRTDEVVEGPYFEYGQLRAHPLGKWIYMFGEGTQTMHRTEASLGPITQGSRELAPNVTEFCWPYWFSERGDLVFTACGNLFSTSEDPNMDLALAGSIPGISRLQRIRALSHSATAGRVVAALAIAADAGTDSLTTYRFPGFEVVSSDPIPSIETAPPGSRSTVFRVFTSQDGRRAMALVLTTKGDPPRPGLPAGLFVTALP